MAGSLKKKPGMGKDTGPGMGVKKAVTSKKKKKSVKKGGY